MLETPVLFLIFNRPDTTKVVFERIRKIKPKFFFVAADGPRPNKPREKELCEESKKIVDKIDWECELKVLFREENLGCKIAISSAITWFFDQVENGIILEDDCVPELSFFSFCQQMLSKYKNDERIMAITGDNHLVEIESLKTDYYFSRLYSCWGWATWRRAWKLYDINMAHLGHLISSNQLLYNFNRRQANYFLNMFLAAKNNKINTWDVQWLYSIVFNSGLTIFPKNNLISNIGVVGTHSNSTAFKYIPTKNIIKEQLEGPTLVYPDYKIDMEYFKLIFKVERKPIVFRIKRKLKKIIKWN